MDNIELNIGTPDIEINFETGVRGPQGPVGPQGPANSLEIGTVTKGDEAGASITGESPNQTLNLTLPKGDKGDKGDTGAAGPSNNLEIGTVTKGNDANATITGASPNQTLNLVLPKGDKGDSGVWVGSTQPVGDYNVWIDPNSNADDIPTIYSAVIEEITQDQKVIFDETDLDYILLNRPVFLNLDDGDGRVLFNKINDGDDTIWYSYIVMGDNGGYIVLNSYILAIDVTNEECILVDTSGDLQYRLISGSNIKTINNQSILGSGNLDIETLISTRLNSIEARITDLENQQNS